MAARDLNAIETAETPPWTIMLSHYKSSVPSSSSSGDSCENVLFHDATPSTSSVKPTMTDSGTTDLALSSIQTTTAGGPLSPLSSWPVSTLGVSTLDGSWNVEEQPPSTDVTLRKIFDQFVYWVRHRALKVLRFYWNQKCDDVKTLHSLRRNTRKGIESVRNHLENVAFHYRRARGWHRNIQLMLCLRVLHGLTSFRQGIVLDNLITMRFGGDVVVLAVIQALGSVVGVITAVVIGLLADKYARWRPYMMRGLGHLGFGFVGLTLIALWRLQRSAGTHNMGMIIVTYLLWRMWYELVFVVSEAIFTDSIPAGRKGYFFTLRSSVNTIAHAAGPIVAILSLSSESSTTLQQDMHWQADSLQRLLLIGTVMSTPEMLTLLFWKKPPYGSNTKNSTVDSTYNTSQRRSGSNSFPMKANDSGEQCTSSVADIEEHQDKSALSDNHPTWKLLPSAVPWILVVSQCLHFAGAGMAVQHIPVFFKEKFRFLPKQALLLNSIYSVCTGISTQYVHMVSRRLGRVQTSILLSSIACLFTFSLAATNTVVLAVVLHLLRGAMQNGITPLTRSIQMDFTSLGSRGKWTAFGALLRLLFSTLSLYGGPDIQHGNFSRVFYVSGVLFVLATVSTLPLLKLVPKQEEQIDHIA